VDGVEVEPKISDFLAPAYSLASLGADYKPNDNFSVFVSPLTAKMTIVNVDRLAMAYGVEEGENFRLEIGAFVKLAYQKDIFENVNLDTRLDLFANYSNNPQNIDVNWETLITMKINKWLSARLSTQLIYDDDIDIIAQPAETNADGDVITPAVVGPRTQFKEIFALGLSVTF
jgi:hypothetical protein